jgi:hypothetical protein
MSYTSIHRCATDPSFMNRLVACVADEGAAEPENEAARLVWPVAAADDIEAAYESALAADNPDPGGDPSVISDAMILGVVQANPPT